MDRELPSEIVRNRRIRTLVVVLLGVLVVVAAFLLLGWLTSASVKRSRIRTAVAEIGRVDATVQASGTVIPAFEEAITAPITSTVEAVFLQVGDSVKAGQSILRLDRTALESSRQQTHDALELQRTRKRQLSLQLERQRIEIEGSYDLKQLQAKYARAQYNRDKYLFDIGGLSGDDLARSELSLQMAEREMAKLAATVENQRAALEIDLAAVELEIRIQQSRLQEIIRQLELAEARPTHDGVITWISDGIGSSVTAGAVIARVADLRTFKVDASISDVHAVKLIAGGIVRVKLGNQSLDGRIAAVRPAVKDGVMDFLVTLSDSGNQSLRPNQRADVFVVTATHDSVLRVVNGPFYTGVRDQSVFVLDGGQAVVRKVDIGASNVDWVELQGNIKPGDEIIISDMRKYQNLSHITIEQDQ
jgi:HlyD family secretion protein